MTRILIVEDEPNMVAGLRDNFEFEGYDVITAQDGVAGLQRALDESPDLVLLDVMMPRMSGLDVCKQLKTKRPSIPVIMLTARGQEVDKVVGLELGADDYVTKPFNHLELLARVKAVLRRLDMPPPKSRAPSFRSGDLEMDFDAQEVRVKGEPVRLTPTEYKLLYHLVRNAGRTLPHGTLLAKVWGREYLDEVDYLRVYVRRLRDKLGDNPEKPRYIRTERGLGYRFLRPA
jgi:DNA-binding response OmpR family regulator